jgi:hypothetical protein
VFLIKITLFYFHSFPEFFLECWNVGRLVEGWKVENHLGCKPTLGAKSPKKDGGPPDPPLAPQKTNKQNTNNKWRGEGRVWRSTIFLG